MTFKSGLFKYYLSGTLTVFDVEVQQTWGMTKRRVIKRRVISESYDFGELCVSHAQTTPTFTNDHTQYLNSLDVFLN